MDEGQKHATIAFVRAVSVSGKDLPAVINITFVRL